MNEMYTDCCVDVLRTISCVNGRVDSVYWYDYGLNGTLNATAIPDKIRIFRVFFHSITGNLTSIPSSILTFDMSSNKLTGTMPLLHPALETFRLHSNLINGGTLSLPNQIQICDIRGMNLQGTIPYLPDSLTYLAVENNLLTGSFPILTTQSKVWYLVLSKNFFNGSISYIPPLLNYIYINNNLISGQVPILPTTIDTFRADRNQLQGNISINKPYYFNISQNLFTNVTIKDKSQLSLSNCDISRNKLVSTSQFTMCNRGNQLLEIPSTAMSTSQPFTFITKLMDSILTDAYTSIGIIDTTYAVDTVDTIDTEETVETRNSSADTIETIDTTNYITVDTTADAITSYSSLHKSYSSTLYPQTTLMLTTSKASIRTSIRTTSKRNTSSKPTTTKSATKSISIEYLEINSNAIVIHITYRTILKLFVDSICLCLLVYKVHYIKRNRGIQKPSTGTDSSLYSFK